MPSEIKRARRALSGEPIIDAEHGQLCEYCLTQSLVNGDRDEIACAVPFDLGEKFIAELWRRARIRNQPTPKRTYFVLHLYHYRHFENGELHIEPEQDYHQLVVSATAGAGTVDEDEYNTDMLEKMSEKDDKYAVFENITKIMYSGPDHGRPIENTSLNDGSSPSSND